MIQLLFDFRSLNADVNLITMSELQSKEEFQRRFEVVFFELANSKGENKFYYNESEYNTVVKEVYEAKEVRSNGGKLTEIQQRRLGRYDIAFDRLVAKIEGTYLIFFQQKKCKKVF